MTETEGRGAISDLLEEFSHRPWHTDAAFKWKEGTLRFLATNDFDKNGMALLDEYGDAINACINYSGNIHLEVEPVRDV
ncbi:hypothetical protein [Azonexus sp. R2A61]|uniref:hypothetical protein n=1 Tax=Azonexus sp. R2A61 TaxID=2744443 RepID=UPI001F2066E7|nr:hypothetical protein [Azonexus sp. R2A61]